MIDAAILIPESEWPALRQRAQAPAFAAALKQLRRDVETFIAQPLAVPESPGGYYHDYFCPQHGVELLFDPSLPTGHRCPVDGAAICGDRFDAAWRWFVNNRLSQGLLRLAVLWRLEGNPDYADQVVDILTGYAARYSGYRGVPRANANRGIATFHTLDESVWVLPLAWAFDLVRDRMSAEQMKTLAEDLLVPAGEFLVQNHFGGIHNFACWHNAAIATVGLVADRADLVDFATNGEFGFESQMRQGVLADGLWFEGSFSYHFYTLAAVLMHLKAVHYSADSDLRDRAAVGAMFAAPVLCSHPDGSLPATNDCWYFTGLIGDCCHGVPPAQAFYEIGYAWYGDPRFAQVLHRAYRHTPRDSLDALLYGAEKVPTDDFEPLPSVHLPASGYAILRTDGGAAMDAPRAEEQAYILLKHGPHGGGHGHPDKLGLILYAQGHRLAADLGTPGYGIDLFESWYRQTISHNAMIVDGRSQPPAEGQILAFGTDGPFQVADARVKWTQGEYKGVAMRRVILARPDYFVDICLVDCGRPRQIDWIYHNAGDLDTSLALGPADALAGDGYEHLAAVERATTDSDLALNWRTDGVGLQLFTAGASGAEIITASSPGNPPRDRRSVVVNRRHAASAAYLSVFHPHGAVRRVEGVRWIGRNLLGAGWAACAVDSDGDRESWSIHLTAEAKAAERSRRSGGSASFEYCLDFGSGGG